MSNVSQSGKPVSFRLHSLRKDGTAFNSWINLFPTYDADGVLTAIGAIGRDISELIKAQSEQALLATIVSASQDAIYTTTPDRIIRTWNSGTEKLYGYSVQEARGKPVTILLPPDSQEEWEDLFNRVLRGEAIRQHETTRMRKDGAVIDVSVSDSPVRDPAGTIVGVAAIAHDITERVRVQRQLENRENYYKSLLRESSDLITVADKSGTIRFSNESVQRILGYTAEEVVGRHIFSFVHPDDLGLAQSRLSKAAEAPNLLTELRLLRRDGTYCNCEGTGGIIVGSDGESLLLMNIRDVTERKSAEREQALLAAIVESSDDAIIGISPDSRVMNWNGGAQRLLGFKPEEAIGQRVVDLYVPSSERIWVEKQIREDFANLKEHSNLVHRLEATMQRKDGSIVSVSLVASGIFDPKGNLFGMSTIVRDDTERQRAEHENAFWQQWSGLPETESSAMRATC